MVERTPRARGGARTPLKQIEFLVLAALVEAPLHGYGIVRAIDERSGGEIRMRPGDVYRVLYRLRQRELIDQADRRPVAELDDERRTYYRITPDGREVVAAEAELLSRVAKGVLAARSVGDEGPIS